MKKLFLLAGLCFLGTHLEAQETPVVQELEEENNLIDEATVKALTESLQNIFKEVESTEDEAPSTPSNEASTN